MDSRTLYLGIFLTSCSLLMLEISLTGVFSLGLWHHFAFLVVSIALLGIGASGSFLTVFPSIAKDDIPRFLGILSIMLCLSILSTLISVRMIPFDPPRIAWDVKQFFYLSLYYIALGIPFFFGGLIISTAISRYPNAVGTIYFSDLVGASVGSVIVLFAIAGFGATKTTVIAALSATLASIIFSIQRRRIIRFITIGLLLAIFFLFKSNSLQDFISPYKELRLALLYPRASILESKWGVQGRVDVIKSPAVRFAPGLSLKYQKELPEQLGITVNGGILNAITMHGYLQRDGKPVNLDFIRYLPSALPYYITERAKVLIPEPGGGLGILTALFHNVRDITVVERNPLVVEAVNRFGGDLYRRVTLHITENRSFLRADQGFYDLIDFSNPGSISASSTGLYSLLEDYTFTVEAFKEYLKHLTDKGMISITRYLLPPPRESPRIVSVAVAALEKMGIRYPVNHIAVIRSIETVTVLIKKTPFTKAELDRIREFCKEKWFDLVFLPDIRPEETNIYNLFPEPIYFNVISSIVGDNRNRAIADYLFDISAVRDENPFFFHFFRLKNFIQTYHSMKDKWQAFIEGGYIVAVAFIQSVVVSVIFIMLPFFIRRRLNSLVSPTDPRKLKILGVSSFRFVSRSPIVSQSSIYVLTFIILYFTCIGIGFMFIEITMIQKLILFLGDPVYSISAVLFSVLLSSGIGSYLTSKLAVSTDRRAMLWRTALIFLVCLLIIYYFMLPTVIDYLIVYEKVWRYIFVVLLIAPLGILMGMPFPLGIRAISEINRSIIPWAWCINGSASVVGSTLAVMLALSIGFLNVLLIAGGMYLVCLLTAVFLPRLSSGQMQHP
ncbi:MAG: hypothetical protein AB1488_09570 [Nitrospirota bacterium]